MLKIVVFDGGWGGETVANFLSQELKTVEIIRAIDWDHLPYEDLPLSEILHHAENCLSHYFDKVDLIVLGGYLVSTLLPELESRHPHQNFIGVDLDYHLITKSKHFPSQIAVFMDNRLIDQPINQTLRYRLPHSEFIFPDCSGWENLINLDEMSRDVLHLELRSDFALSPKVSSHSFIYSCYATTIPSRSTDQNRPLLEVIREQKSAPPQPIIPQRPTVSQTPIELPPPRNQFAPNVILLLNTHFWDLHTDLEQLFGYRVRIIDFRRKLLRDVCTALKLLGVDGRRSK